VNKRRAAAELALADWRQVFATDLDAAFVLGQEFGTRMLQRGHGRQPGSRLRRRQERADRSHPGDGQRAGGPAVEVNAVCRGYIDTRSTGPLRDDPVREPRIRAGIPAGRWGTESDVAAAIVYLCSPAAAYVNGHVFVVDGGCLIQ